MKMTVRTANFICNIPDYLSTPSLCIGGVVLLIAIYKKNTNLIMISSGVIIGGFLQQIDKCDEFKKYTEFVRPLLPKE